MNRSDPAIQAAAKLGRERRDAEYRKRTRSRPCITCGTNFRSEGPHHRMCRTCRDKDLPGDWMGEIESGAY